MRIEFSYPPKSFMNKFLISKDVLANAHQIIHAYIHPIVQMQVRWDVREKLRFGEVLVHNSNRIY